MSENVSWLVSVPCNDANFKARLNAASADEVLTALEIIEDKYGEGEQTGKKKVLAAALRKKGGAV